MFKIILLFIFTAGILQASDKLSELDKLRQKFASSPTRLLAASKEKSQDLLNLLDGHGSFRDLAALEQEYRTKNLADPRYDYQSTQTKFTEMIGKAFNRLWVIAADLTAGKIADTEAARAKLKQGIVNYGELELSREKISNGRFHVSCFMIPTAAGWIYFCLFDDMNKPENSRIAGILQKLAFQAWSVPSRHDDTDRNVVCIERFRKHVWWVGGNATSYRPLLLTALVNRSVPMMDVLAEVAAQSISTVSQTTRDSAFWTEGFTDDGAGWGHGFQCLVWGYPIDGTNGSLKIMTQLKGTPWEQQPGSRELDTIFNYLRGSSFYFYKGTVPPVLDRYNFKAYHGERREIPSASIARILNVYFFDALTAAQQQELLQFLKTGKQNLLMPDDVNGVYYGTRYFYNNDDMIKKTLDYYVLINMSSARTDGLESAFPGCSGYNFYACDGSTMIERDGGEHKLALGAYQLTAWPGVTARQVKKLEPVTNWNGYSSSANFAAGVNSGSDFAAGFIFDKENAAWRHSASLKNSDPNPGICELKAYKSYFMFDDTMVALGGGIENRAPQLDGNIWTTVEQTVKRDYSERSSGGLKWFINGGIAYAVLPQYTTGEVHVVTEQRPTHWRQVGGNPSNTPESVVDVFQLWIDHGQKINNGAYAYLINPKGEMPAKLPLIISNTSKAQAAADATQSVIGAIFYDAGVKLNTRYGQLSVSAPCALLLKLKGDEMEITASDARMDTKLSFISVTIGQQEFNLKLPVEPGRGKAASMKVKLL